MKTAKEPRALLFFDSWKDLIKVKRKAFIREYVGTLGLYYAVVVGGYGFVFAAIAYGASEQDAIVSRPQSLAFWALFAGPIVAVWFVIGA